MPSVPIDLTQEIQLSKSPGTSTRAKSRGRLLEYYRPYLLYRARERIHGTLLESQVSPRDIVQDTNVEALAAWSSFRGTNERELSAWLASILENRIRQTFRKYGTEMRDVARETRLTNSNEGASVVWFELADGEPSPSSQVRRGETALRLLAEVEALPTDQRDAIRMRHLEGLKIDQITSQMDRSYSAVAGLLQRGLKTLRQRLSTIFEDPRVGEEG